MQRELQRAIEEYKFKWDNLAAARANKLYFAHLAPTALGWKTVDQQDFDTRFVALRDLSDQIHLGWVNERWLATFHLKAPLAWGIELVKLMQRRPDSKDAAGLDHLDFLIPDETEWQHIKAQESGLKMTEERNGDHCKWLSIWFDNTEAKLRTDTVLATCIAELQDIRVQ